MSLATVVAVRPKADLMSAAIAFEAVWAAWRERPGLPTSHSYCARFAVSRWAGDGVRGFATAGLAVQFRGGSATDDPLTAGLLGSAVLANALVGGLCIGSARASRRAISPNEWLFCWLWCSVRVFEKSQLSVGTAGFEPATP